MCEGKRGEKPIAAIFVAPAVAAGGGHAVLALVVPRGAQGPGRAGEIGPLPRWGNRVSAAGVGWAWPAKDRCPQAPACRGLAAICVDEPLATGSRDLRTGGSRMQRGRTPERPQLCLQLGPDGKVVVASANSRTGETVAALPRITELARHATSRLSSLDKRLAQARARQSNLARKLALTYGLPVFRLLMLPLLLLWRWRWKASRNREIAATEEAAELGSSLSFVCNDQTIDAYEALAARFFDLSKAGHLWRIDLPHADTFMIDRLHVDTAIPRIACSLAAGGHRALRADSLTLTVRSDGFALYILPFFAVVERESGDVAVYSLRDLKFEFRDVLWLEEADVKDATVVSRTTGRDRGGAATQWPIMRYGGLKLHLSESDDLIFMGSSFDALREFASALQQYWRALADLAAADGSADGKLFVCEAKNASEETLAVVAAQPPKARWMPVADLSIVAVAAATLMWLPTAEPMRRILMDSVSGVSASALWSDAVDLLPFDIGLSVEPETAEPDAAATSSDFPPEPVVPEQLEMSPAEPAQPDAHAQDVSPSEELSPSELDELQLVAPE